MLHEERLHFNGLDGTTGAPLLQPVTPAELLAWIEGADTHEAEAVKDTLRTIRTKRIEATRKGLLGVIEGIDALDVTQARWGVVYRPDTPAEVRQALKPLVDARQGSEFTYVPGESSMKFRARHGQGPAKVDPAKLPYYLLIVGSPAEIPFRFQYGLDAEHAVGRLYFKDAATYGRYVKNVLAYESATSPLPRERRVALFSPQNPGDDATFLSATELAQPLAQALDGKLLTLADGQAVSYRTEQITKDKATKPALLELLTRTTHAPALLLVAAHGLGFPNGHPRQLENQGALTCQEWPGPNVALAGTMPDSMYFAGRSLPAEADLNGLIVLAFACYSAGTPHLDDFALFTQQAPKELAPQPFIADLPQRLLAQGVLAFIGHVDRAWDYSYLWKGVGRDISTFRSTLESILAGKPVGHAFEYFNDRYVVLARELTDSEEEGLLYKYHLGEPVDAKDLVALWTAHNDARAYILFGDPLVRLKPGLMASGET